MTVIEIVNRVLRRLREDRVTSLSETPYSQMVVDMLVDVHAELIASHDWSFYEHTIDVPLTTGQRVYDLSRVVADGGNVSPGGRLPTNDSHVLSVFVFDNNTDPEGQELRPQTPAVMDAEYQKDRDGDADYPYWYSVAAHPDRSGLQLQLWPAPTRTLHLRLRLWTPEAEIDIDEDAARTLLMPSRPLTLGTLMLALNERGEELGEPGNVAERRYYSSIADAIESDVNRKAYADRYTAERV